MIGDIVACYSLRGFSFREYVNLKTGNHFHPHTLEGMLQQHETIAHEVAAEVDVESLFKEYLHHGFYPFFLEHTNYSENLLKTMNMMIEVDVLLIRQIELKYLTKSRSSTTCWPWRQASRPTSASSPRPSTPAAPR